MKILKYFFYICLFFIVGETLIRIDLRFDLLNHAPKNIHVTMEESSIKQSVDQGNFETNPNQLRILIIGDSYIHGRGIETEHKFSKKLSENLISINKTEKEIVILDISRPSNNTQDNYNSFIHYQDKFKPNLVFWDTTLTTY